MSYKKRSNWKSFRNAWWGILYTSKTQRHFRFHLCASILVLLAAFWLQVERWEWVVLLLTISSVMAAEAINTAIELVVDLAEPNFHPLAGLAKDVAAGAVLITAIISVFVGIIIFGPYIQSLLPMSS